MEQYISKAAVVAEIEKRINFNETLNAHSRLDECNAILSFIDTLEVKDPYEQCIQYASIESGIRHENIRNCAAKQIVNKEKGYYAKSAGGYKWEFIDKY